MPLPRLFTRQTKPSMALTQSGPTSKSKRVSGHDSTSSGCSFPSSTSSNFSTILPLPPPKPASCLSQISPLSATKRVLSKLVFDGDGSRTLAKTIIVPRPKLAPPFYFGNHESSPFVHPFSSPTATSCDQNTCDLAISQFPFPTLTIEDSGSPYPTTFDWIEDSNPNSRHSFLHYIEDPAASYALRIDPTTFQNFLESIPSSASLSPSVSLVSSASLPSPITPLLHPYAFSTNQTVPRICYDEPPASVFPHQAHALEFQDKIINSTIPPLQGDGAAVEVAKLEQDSSQDPLAQLEVISAHVKKMKRPMCQNEIGNHLHLSNPCFHCGNEIRPSAILNDIAFLSSDTCTSHDDSKRSMWFEFDRSEDSDRELNSGVLSMVIEEPEGSEEEKGI